MSSISFSTTSHVSQVAPVGAGTVSSDPVEAATSLMPEPKNGDVGLIVAQLAIESAFTRRKQAREDRQHATSGMIAAQKEQIAHLKEEAEKRFTAAKTEAWGKIIGGAHGVAGGVLTATSVKGGPQGLTPRANANEGIGKSVDAAGDVYGGVASLMAASHARGADRASAAAKADEMEATAQRRALETADDEIKEARDHVRTALDFLREFQSTQSRTMASAIKG